MQPSRNALPPATAYSKGLPVISNGQKEFSKVAVLYG